MAWNGTQILRQQLQQNVDRSLGQLRQAGKDAVDATLGATTSAISQGTQYVVKGAQNGYSKLPQGVKDATQIAGNTATVLGGGAALGAVTVADLAGRGTGYVAQKGREIASTLDERLPGWTPMGVAGAGLIGSGLSYATHSPTAAALSGAVTLAATMSPEQIKQLIVRSGHTVRDLATKAGPSVAAAGAAGTAVATALGHPLAVLHPVIDAATQHPIAAVATGAAMVGGAIADRSLATNARLATMNARDYAQHIGKEANPDRSWGDFIQRRLASPTMQDIEINALKYLSILPGGETLVKNRLAKAIDIRDAEHTAVSNLLKQGTIPDEQLISPQHIQQLAEQSKSPAHEDLKEKVRESGFLGGIFNRKATEQVRREDYVDGSLTEVAPLIDPNTVVQPRSGPLWEAQRLLLGIQHTPEEKAAKEALEIAKKAKEAEKLLAGNRTPEEAAQVTLIGGLDAKWAKLMAENPTELIGKPLAVRNINLRTDLAPITEDNLRELAKARLNAQQKAVQTGASHIDDADYQKTLAKFVAKHGTESLSKIGQGNDRYHKMLGAPFKGEVVDTVGEDLRQIFNLTPAELKPAKPFNEVKASTKAPKAPKPKPIGLEMTTITDTRRQVLPYPDAARELRDVARQVYGTPGFLQIDPVVLHTLNERFTGDQLSRYAHQPNIMDSGDIIQFKQALKEALQQYT